MKSEFKAVSAGGSHSLALKNDGTIVGWGDNSYGQATPPEGNDFTAIAAGGCHSLALRSNGTIIAWGNFCADDGVPSPDGNDYIAIGGGSYYAIALKTDGSIIGWDDGHQPPSPPIDGDDYVAIEAGQYHALALKSDGSIAGIAKWSGNGYGEATPPSGNNYIAISAGEWHSLALKSDGSVVGWGKNDYGQGAPPAQSVMIVERYSYDVFGKPTIRDANNSVVSASSVANRFMFTGREYDYETANYYYRARYYSPKLGRFLQTDPIGYAIGLNLYTYCSNNSINFIDPYGLWSFGSWFYTGNGGYNITPDVSSAYWGGFAQGARYGWEEWSNACSFGIYDEIGWTNAAEQRQEYGAIGTATAVSAQVGAAAAWGVLGLTAGGQLGSNDQESAPDKECPKPPGWNEDWERGPGSRENNPESWWDPEGGEWRYHPSDAQHPNSHWDYNPWNEYNSPWQNVPIPK